MSEILRSPKLRPWHLDRVAILFFSIVGWAFVAVSFWFISWSNKLRGELEGGKW